MDPFDIFPLPASIMLTFVSSKRGETLQGEGDARPHLVVLFGGIPRHRRCLHCSTPPPTPEELLRRPVPAMENLR